VCLPDLSGHPAERSGPLRPGLEDERGKAVAMSRSPSAGALGELSTERIHPVAAETS
jgi:hypothetical protein